MLRTGEKCPWCGTDLTRTSQGLFCPNCTYARPNNAYAHQIMTRRMSRFGEKEKIEKDPLDDFEWN